MTKLVPLLLPISLLAGITSPARAQARLAGRVFDAGTDAPIADVLVGGADRPGEVRTDRYGTFSIACTDGITLVFQKPGYESARRTVASCAEVVQVGLVPSAQSLNELTVVGTAQGANIQQPQSVATLTGKQLHRASGLFLEEALNLIPGVRMEKRTMAGGDRITIRGYGNASNFIGTGYKAYLNGIPITDAEGQTILDDIDFPTVGRVEVVRGPASSIYGAGIGGVVNLYTERPHQPGTNIVQELTAGEDGLLRSDTRLENVSSGATTMLDYGHQDYDGYRIHSGSRKDFGTFLGEFRPSERRTVTTYLAYANSRDDRAGQLDSAQFFNKENTGEGRYLDNDAHQAIESVRAGVTHSYRFNDRIQQQATAYFSGSTLEDVYAAGLNEKTGQNFGGRMVFNTTFMNSAGAISGVTGGEFQKTNGAAKGYGMTGGVLGGMRSDLETYTMQYSVFSQWDVALPANFTLTAGASANFIEYGITDRLANSANPKHADGSGRKVFDPVITPRLALRKMFGNDISVYANVSQGYSPPTSADAVIPFTGEPNEGLEPERATLYEIGSKGNILDGRLSYQLALFDMRVSDKLTPRAVFDDDGTVLYSYTVNAGDQTNRGLELAAVFNLLDRPDQLVSMVRPFINYTYSDFTYRNFRSDAGGGAGSTDYSGNQVVGVSPNVFDVGVDAALRWGGYMSATYQHRDDLKTSFDNSHFAPGFSLLNARIGVARELGHGISIDAFAGGNNLGNSLYYTMVFLNHKFDSPTPPHMYLPGPYQAKYYGGLKFSYRP